MLTEPYEVSDRDMARLKKMAIEVLDGLRRGYAERWAATENSDERAVTAKLADTCRAAANVLEGVS